MRFWALALGGVMAAVAAVGAAAQAEPRRSGYADMSPATQALQADDTRNPGLLWVQDGAALWAQPAGDANKACADCHGDAAVSMRGVSARHPAWDAVSAAPVNLTQRINACRVRQQRAVPLALDSQPLLALEAFVARQSRGLPLAQPDDARLVPATERGRARFEQRLGQLDLSCAHCHDQRAGGRLGAAVIPQGHANGYPTYRLEWQGLGSLQRRLRNCLTGVRAEPWPLGAPELVELELFLAQRSRGLAVEAPAVRP